VADSGQARSPARHMTRPRLEGRGFVEYEG
jgi:hypothetical protein